MDVPPPPAHAFATESPGSRGSRLGVKSPTVLPPLARDPESATPFPPATCRPISPSTRQNPQGLGAAFSGQVLAEWLSRPKSRTTKNALRRDPLPHPPRRILPAPSRRTAHPKNQDSQPISLDRRGFGGVTQRPEGVDRPGFVTSPPVPLSAAHPRANRSRRPDDRHLTHPIR